MDIVNIDVVALAAMIADEINAHHIYYDNGMQCPIMYSGIRSDVAMSLGISPNSLKYQKAFNLLKVEINILGLMWVVPIL